MKIYKHEYNSYKNEVVTTAYEAEEKPKTYIIAVRWGNARISKEDINKLQGRYTKEMYTFSADPTTFIEALIKYNEKCIESIKANLERTEAQKTSLLKILNRKGAQQNENTA